MCYSNAFLESRPYLLKSWDFPMKKFFCVATLSFSALAQANESSYFFGEDVMSGPTGVHYQTTPKLLKRTLDRKGGTISEVVVTKTYQSGFAETQLTLLVAGRSFELRAQGAGYSGKGVLFGKPWDWSGWTSEIEIPDGAKVRVLDHLGTHGLDAVSEYYDPTGQLVSITKTQLRPIDEKTFSTLRRKLLLGDESISQVRADKP